MCVKHSNIAIFVPHIGCPNQCSFCNQNSISGATDAPSAKDVHSICTSALEYMGSKAENAEIAFFGGSFTAIEHDYMVELLSAASEYVGKGKFYGIRVSTRPDAINKKNLAILQKYGVTSIELGAQSMEQSVLDKNHRGHTAADVETASELIKNHGFSLGLQMMISLYGSTEEYDRETAKKLAELKPDTMRIYPTVIIKNTMLEKLYNEKKYLPMDIISAVAFCAELLEFFEEKNINVIRLGLHASETLEADIVGGIYHGAFRELCENRLMLKKILAEIETRNIPKGELVIEVNPSDVSKVIGQKRCNALHLYSLGYGLKIRQNHNITKNIINLL